MRLFLIPISLLFTIVLSAQNSKEFTRVNEFYIHGNTQVIGNNNVSKHQNKATGDKSGVNDGTKMKYVDIDENSSTFNSSSANLTIPEDTTLKYAALYWTATYPTEKGTKVAKGRRYVYKANGEPTKDIQEIQFKVPGGNYMPLRGELVYDGKQGTVKGITSSRPYTCYKDITDIIKNNQTINGTYTVANIPVTQGYISGGSAAGWMLYVIYEREQDPLQYITTYQGFNHIDKKGVDIDFGNFKASEKAETQTAITISALEGDLTLKKDQIAIYYPKEKKFVTLDNDVRASNNFFNSSITIDNFYFTDRTPNSKNTLGFDIAKITIPNAINESIATSASGFKLQFKTREDRYYVYFAAFQTTLNETFYQDVTTTADLDANSKEQEVAEETVPETVTETTPKEAVEDTRPVIVKEDLVIQEKQIEVKTTPKKETEIIDNTTATISDKKPTKTTDVLKGYHIISNVFSSEENAEKWVKKLEAKNIKSMTFKGPKNNLYYVSIGNNESLTVVREELKQIRQDEDLKDAWVFKINSK
ncbi:SPOR domain-containing protein [Dokdonia ponticola]|uniref:SPOR domain-containing protein n=1 Tax=Dokdonia ponticola TaxID=2041041 RepID=A0ABV9HVZ1_9FLAO